MGRRRLALALGLAVLGVLPVAAYLARDDVRTAQFEVSYDSRQYDHRIHSEGAADCRALPGHVGTETLLSSPPIDVVTVAGAGRAKSAVRRCFAAIPGARLTERP